MNGRILLVLAIGFFFIGCRSVAQNSISNGQGLDASLFWKSSGEYVDTISSEKGSLYLKLGHHGPAIENLWVAYRVYFNDFGGVDIFSKFKPGLELKKTKWYPSKSQRAEGFGSDNYQAGKTTGLGGIKLWNGKNFQNLGPVTKRIAEVILNDTLAQIVLTSYAIPFKDSLIDIEFKLSTSINTRHAVIEVRELNGTEVEWVTGMPIHSELKVASTDGSIIAWGDYDSHEKHAVFNLGVALLYNPANFQRDMITEKEHLLISKPTSYLKYYVSSSNEKEDSDLNTYKAFENYVEQLKLKLIYN